MTLQEDFLRKAAVLIATLDDQSAEALLEELGREQALQLKRMLSELAPITVDEQSQIIHEFMQTESTEAPLEVESDGVEVDDSLAARIAADDVPTLDDEVSEPPPVDVPEHSPFSFLAGVAPDLLSDLLAGEHAQTISVVLSYLSPKTAANVLQRLPASRQSDVLQRLGQLHETDAAVVAEIEEELQRVFQRRISVQDSPPLGLAAVRAILDAAGDVERRRLVEQLQQHAPEVLQNMGTDAPVTGRATTTQFHAISSTSRPHGGSEAAFSAEANQRELAAESQATTPVVDQTTRPASKNAVEGTPRVALDFDDLNTLDDKALALVFSKADPEVALVALTGASSSLTERIRRQLPWREARDLKAQTERLGPIRLSDVERAQQRLAEVAIDLIQKGLIDPPKNRRFIFAA